MSRNTREKCTKGGKEFQDFGIAGTKTEIKGKNEQFDCQNRTRIGFQDHQKVSWNLILFSYFPFATEGNRDGKKRYAAEAPLGIRNFFSSLKMNVNRLFDHSPIPDWRLISTVMSSGNHSFLFEWDWNEPGTWTVFTRLGLKYTCKTNYLVMMILGPFKPVLNSKYFPWEHSRMLCFQGCRHFPWQYPEFVGALEHVFVVSPSLQTNHQQ